MSTGSEIIKWTRWEKALFFLVVFASLALYGIVAVLPYAALNYHRFVVKDQLEVERIKSVLAQLGTMGDMFGAVNALFTGFALTGLVYTAILQRKEIKAQQIELNRAEQDRAELLEKQRLEANRTDMERMDAKIQWEFDEAARVEKARKDNLAKNHEQSYSAYLNATSILAQLYTQMYNGNITAGDRDYENAVNFYGRGHAQHSTPPDETVKGQMILYRDILRREFNHASNRFQILSSRFYEDYTGENETEEVE